MQHYNQLLSLKYEGINLKFESLILLKYFQIISKHTEFKKISEELKTLILDNYKSFDKKHNIQKLSLNVIDDYILDFKEYIINENIDKLQELYDYMINNIDDKKSHFESSHKIIVYYFDDFKSDIIKTYFMKSLNIRSKFYGIE